MYTSTNRCKHYLKVHMIFVCKYRRKILIGNFVESIKTILKEISDSSDFEIETMEVDKDPIHLLIAYLPRARHLPKQLGTILRIRDEHSSHPLKTGGFSAQFHIKIAKNIKYVKKTKVSIVIALVHIYLLLMYI